MSNEVFNRRELKYLIHTKVYKEILTAIKPRLCMDEYGDADGFYTICNLYFDTQDNFFHKQNVEREVFRQKLRLRVYGKAALEDPVFLEIKKNMNGIINKRRTQIKLKDAYRFLEMSREEDDISAFEVSNRQIFKEIHFLRKFYDLQMKMILSYDRQAFKGMEDENLRITFDKNIRSRDFDLRMEMGSHGKLFVPGHLVVMEVKASDSVPLWLARIINEHSCVKRRFSKYSTCVEMTVNSCTKFIIPEVLAI